MRCSPNAGVMLGQRRRRWPNINPTLGEHLEIFKYIQEKVENLNVKENTQQARDAHPMLS